MGARMVASMSKSGTSNRPWAPTPQITLEDVQNGSYAYSPPKAKFKNGEVNPWTHVRILRTEGVLPESIRNRDKVRTPPAFLDCPPLTTCATLIALLFFAFLRSPRTAH